MGHFTEAEAEVRRARELDPLSPIVNMALPEVYTWEHREDDAIAEYKKIVIMDPAFCGAHGNLAYLYERKRMYAEALEEQQRNSALAGDSDFMRKLQKIYATSGYEAMLREELMKELEDRAQGKYGKALGIASYYAMLGDEAHALEWIEKGYEERSSGMQYLAIDPQFDAIRSNPKYQYWLGVLNLSAVKPRT
jgi:tetratricopeptide (TPR) repeat protein